MKGPFKEKNFLLYELKFTVEYVIIPRFFGFKKKLGTKRLIIEFRGVKSLYGRPFLFLSSSLISIKVSKIKKAS